MAKIVMLLVLVAAVQMSYALQCYNCGNGQGPQDDSCENFNKDKVQTTSCGKAAGNLKAYCLKRVLKSTSSNMLNVTRKCILLPENSDPQKSSDCTTNQQGFEQKECLVCEEDFCNAASSMSFPIFAAIGAVFSIIAVRCFVY